MGKKWLSVAIALALVLTMVPAAYAGATTGVFTEDGEDVTHLYAYPPEPEAPSTSDQSSASSSGSSDASGSGSSAPSGSSEWVDATDGATVAEQAYRPAAEGRGYSRSEISGSPRMVLEIDLTNKIVTAYGKDALGDYRTIIRQMICSIGTEETPTVAGWFSTSDRKRWYYFAEFNVFAQYMTRFYGGYMFHSVLFKKQSVSQLSTTSVGNLGKAVSHGCVRLPVADAKWIHDNAVSGTPVFSGTFAKNTSAASKLKEAVSTSKQRIIYDGYTPMPSSMTIPRTTVPAAKPASTKAPSSAQAASKVSATARPTPTRAPAVQSTVRPTATPATSLTSGRTQQ